MVGDALPVLDEIERIADANWNADQALELAVDPRGLGEAAGEHDLAEAERVRLILVELERRDELPCECLELPLHRGACCGRALRVEAARDERATHAERAACRLCCRRRELELARDRDVQGEAAPIEDARELADAVRRDREDRAVVT